MPTPRASPAAAGTTARRQRHSSGYAAINVGEPEATPEMHGVYAEWLGDWSLQLRREVNYSIEATLYHDGIHGEQKCPGHYSSRRNVTIFALQATRHSIRLGSDSSKQF